MTARPWSLRVAAVAAAGALAACSSGEGGSDAGSAAAPSSPAAVAEGASTAVDLPALVRQVEPSVVTVLVPGGGQGSGVVYREDGVIVTNEHVVGEAQDVVIAFADGQRVPGQVVAADAVVDVAVVRVERDDLPTPEYRTELPEVGELAVVIGSPLGFVGSVTAGIISGLGREIPGAAAAGQQSLVDLIQTDAPISPGNSGGALIDAKGRVVGLSEAYIPPAQGAVALGFAIPAATVVRVADELLEDGRAEHAFLGVRFGELTPQIAEQLDVDREGALVLAAGDPAAAAGLRPGDVIVQAGSERIRRVEDVLGVLRRLSPGDRLELRILREGREQSIEVVLADRPV